MPPNRPPRRGPGRYAGPDALVLLEDDHRCLRDLFHRCAETGDEASRQRLTGEICTTLRIHREIELELLYPACGLSEDYDLLDEAGLRQEMLLQLVERLETGALPPEDRDALRRELAEHAFGHFELEEDELFPRLRNAGLDLRWLGAQVQALRADLQRDLAPAYAAAEAAPAGELRPAG